MSTKDVAMLVEQIQGVLGNGNNNFVDCVSAFWSLLVSALVHAKAAEDEDRSAWAAETMLSMSQQLALLATQPNEQVKQVVSDLARESRNAVEKGRSLAQ